jgi:hypothetical protein
MLFFFIPTVSLVDKDGRKRVNHGRHPHTPAEVKFEMSNQFIVAGFDGAFVNVRRQITHSNKHEFNQRPVFIASHADGTSLVMGRFIREAILPRERRQE